MRSMDISMLVTHLVFLCAIYYRKICLEKEQSWQKRVNMQKVILFFIFFVYAFVMFLTYFYISLYTYSTLFYFSF